MHTQKYKVKHNTDGTEVFFFDHSFKTAKNYAEEYIAKHKKDSVSLYQVNNTPYGERWRIV